MESPAPARPLHGETQGAVYSPRLAFHWITAVSSKPPYHDRSAQEIAAVVLFHRFVGVHEILAIGGGVARVRDELHGLAEIISTDRRSLCEAKSLEW